MKGMTMDPENVAAVDEDVIETAEATVPLRELVMKAYPDIVPELLSGETVEEMLASIPAAQEAYGRIVEASKAAHPEPIPAVGGARHFPMDVAAMSPALKIREGLRRKGYGR
jgi:hypothetical protein